MERPKRIANIIIGTQASMATASGTPICSRRTPHWKTATTTPNAAPTESRFMIAACKGTSSERNSIMSRTNEMRMTAPMNHGRREATRSDRSTPTAVGPVA